MPENKGKGHIINPLTTKYIGHNLCLLVKGFISKGVHFNMFCQFTGFCLSKQFI